MRVDEKKSSTSRYSDEEWKEHQLALEVMHKKAKVHPRKESEPCE